MKRILTYLLVVAATVYTAIIYGSTSFLMLFYVELFLPLLLIITLIPAIRGLRIRLYLPVPVIRQGERAQVRFRSNQRLPFPGGRISVQVKVYPPLQKKSEKTWFHFPVYRGGRRFFGKQKRTNSSFDDDTVMKAEYLARYAGNVRLEITKVWCQDLLGILSIPIAPKYWKTQEPVNLLVLPKISEMPVMVSRQSRDFAGESEEYSKERGGDDVSEIFQIREYRSGDKMRSIHWKISAKTEELMVREQSLPLGCPVDFYLDFSGRSKKKKEQSEIRDSYFQVAASVSHSLVREGCRHYLIWYDGTQHDIFRYRIEKEEDIYEALLRMGHLEAENVACDLPELYRKKYHDAPGITRLALKMDLTLYQNEEVLRKYKGSLETLEQQLAQTELVV
jgi:hypothetical protein